MRAGTFRAPLPNSSHSPFPPSPSSVQAATKSKLHLQLFLLGAMMKPGPAAGQGCLEGRAAVACERPRCVKMLLEQIAAKPHLWHSRHGQDAGSAGSHSVPALLLLLPLHPLPGGCRMELGAFSPGDAAEQTRAAQRECAASSEAGGRQGVNSTRTS